MGQIYIHETCSAKCSMMKVCWCGRSLSEINILFMKGYSSLGNEQMELPSERGRS